MTITATEVTRTASFVNMSASGMTSTTVMVMIPGKVVTVSTAGLQGSVVPAHVGVHPRRPGTPPGSAGVSPGWPPDPPGSAPAAHSHPFRRKKTTNPAAMVPIMPSENG